MRICKVSGSGSLCSDEEIKGFTGWILDIQPFAKHLENITFYCVLQKILGSNLEYNSSPKWVISHKQPEFPLSYSQHKPRKLPFRFRHKEGFASISKKQFQSKIKNDAITQFWISNPKMWILTSIYHPPRRISLISDDFHVPSMWLNITLLNKGIKSYSTTYSIFPPSFFSFPFYYRHHSCM